MIIIETLIDCTRQLIIDSFIYATVLAVGVVSLISFFYKKAQNN